MNVSRPRCLVAIVLLGVLGGALDYRQLEVVQGISSHADQVPALLAHKADAVDGQVGQADFLGQLLAVPEGGRRMQLLGDRIAQVELQEIGEYLSRISLIADPDIQFDLRRVVLARWASMDGNAAMKYVSELPPGGPSVLLEAAVLEHWAIAEPRDATAWLEARWSPDGGPKWPKALGSGLATQPFATVLSCLSGISDPSARRDLGDAILDSWLKNPLDDAADLATFLYETSGETSLLGRVAATWGEQNLVMALAWAQGVQGQSGRAAALGHLSAIIAECESAQIPALLAQVSVTENASFFSALVSRWAQRDAAAATAWALTLSTGPVKDCVMQSLAVSVGMIDPVAMKSLVESFPAELRESAVSALAAAWAARDINATLEWAQSLRSGELRQQALTTTLSVWFQRAPAEMLLWAVRQPPNSQQDLAILAIVRGLREDMPDLAARLNRRFSR